MKIDSTNYSPSSSVSSLSSPTSPRNGVAMPHASAAAPKARAAERRDFAERLQHQLQALKHSSRSSLSSLSVTASSHLDAPRRQLWELPEDPVRLIGGSSSSCDMPLSAHSHSAIAANMAPLVPGGHLEASQRAKLHNHRKDTGNS